MKVCIEFVVIFEKGCLLISKMTSNLNGINEKSDPEDELQNVSDFFEANATFIERWLKEKAPDEVVNKINSIASKRTSKEKEHRSSVTSELYQQWLSSSNTPLKVSKELFASIFFLVAFICCYPLNIGCDKHLKIMNFSTLKAISINRGGWRSN